MLHFFKKQPENISRTTPGFEESERKTPKTGAILLIVMFFAGLFFGWRALDDLASIPSRPAPLSSCSYRYSSAYVADAGVKPYAPRPLYYDYGNYRGDYADTSQCQLTELEKTQGIPQLLEKRRPIEEELQKLRTKAATVEASLRNISDQIQRQTREYG